jgi:SAM-dependent methyltransferase
MGTPVTASSERFRIPDAELGARLYAALHRGNAGDVEFYVRVCRGRKRLRVLELGAGAGRITLELARRGHDLTGVELNRALYLLAMERLACAQREERLGAVRFVEENMVKYRSDVTFDKVLIPYSAFWCLPSNQQKQKCLRAVAELLKPDGELVLDVYSADHLYEEVRRAKAKQGEEPVVDEFELTEHALQLDDGRSYRVFERNLWWPARKHTRVEYGLEGISDPSEQWLMVLDHHYLWRHELARLLEQAGFETDWGADEAASGSAFEHQVVVRGLKQ